MVIFLGSSSFRCLTPSSVSAIAIKYTSLFFGINALFFLSLLQDGNLFECPDLQGVPHLQHNLQGGCYRIGRWWVAEQIRLFRHRWDPDIMFNLMYVCENNRIVTKQNIRFT